MVRDYTIFHRRTYDAGDEEKPFCLSFCHADVYASRDFTERQARQLIRDIQEALGEGVPDMQHGDLGQTDPDDILF